MSSELSEGAKIEVEVAARLDDFRKFGAVAV